MKYLALFIGVAALAFSGAEAQARGSIPVSTCLNPDGSQVYIPDQTFQIVDGGGAAECNADAQASAFSYETCNATCTGTFLGSGPGDLIAPGNGTCHIHCYFGSIPY